MSFTTDYKMAIVAIVFIIFDIVTGVASAFITGTFKSSTMRQGGARKLFLCITLAFGIALDFVQGLVDLGFNVPAVTAIGGYIAFMEILSCIENINKAYPNALPKTLVKALYSAAEEQGVDTTAETNDESGKEDK